MHVLIQGLDNKRPNITVFGLQHSFHMAANQIANELSRDLVKRALARDFADMVRERIRSIVSRRLTIPVVRASSMGGPPFSAMVDSSLLRAVLQPDAAQGRAA